MAEDFSIPNPTAPSSQGEIDELSEEGRARKRQEQAEARARGRSGRKGLVIVNTGNGKGKTTYGATSSLFCDSDVRLCFILRARCET